MKMMRVTAAMFNEQEPEIPDAVLSESDPIQNLKRMAGLPTDNHSADDSGRMSPVGNIAGPSNKQRRALEREYDIKTGTPEWFRLWFAKPDLTGEEPVDPKTKPSR